MQAVDELARKRLPAFPVASSLQSEVAAGNAGSRFPRNWSTSAQEVLHLARYQTSHDFLTRCICAAQLRRPVSRCALLTLELTVCLEYCVVSNYKVSVSYTV